MTRLAAALLLSFAFPLAAGLTPQELRGRQIYRTGESPSGQPIVALVGPEDLDVPATSLPCMSCHGADGRGKAEGGIRPSNLQWHALTKPYPAPGPDGRAHPPYTPALLRRAITMGTDPAKQRLNPVMPRYRLTMQDAEDLVAYVQRLGDDPDPGLTDDELTIGLLLEGSPDTDAIRTALRTHFDAVNASGGIFGRRIRLTEEGEPFAYLALRASSGADPGDIPTLAAVPTLEEQCRRLLAGRGKVRIVHDAATAPVAASLAAHHDPSSRTVLYLTPPPAVPPDADTILIPAFFTTETALVAARTLTTALRRAGRDVDRAKLATLLSATRRPAPRVVQVQGGKFVPVD